MNQKKSSIYYISKSEINRRIRAYTTLISSFLVSIIIFSFNYILRYINISLCILIILSILLVGSRIITVKYFKSIMKNKITMTSEYIIRNKNKYFIKNIKQISIKRTTGDYIREIKIIFNKNIITYINGIDKLEEFSNELEGYLPKNAIKINYKEPIAFDHPTFYFFFGILVGLFSVKITEFILSLNPSQLIIFYYIVSLFTILFGLYFIITKPIYRRDAKNKQITDYIWGMFFIIAGIFITILYILK